jgi:hypothetical protein
MLLSLFGFKFDVIVGKKKEDRRGGEGLLSPPRPGLLPPAVFRREPIRSDDQKMNKPLQHGEDNLLHSIHGPPPAEIPS